MSGSGPTKRIEDWQSPRPNDPPKPPVPGGNEETVAVPGPGGVTPSPGGNGVVSGSNTVMPGAQRPEDGAGGGMPPPNLPGLQPIPGEPVDFMNDPVVGWLVITKGPGRGAGLRLGAGMNTVGRASTNRVVLNFGDNSISRDKHCIVTFEPRARQYFIQNESGTHLTYVSDTVVLKPEPLHNGQVIQIGETEMRFVSFCGEDFSWDDTEE